MVFNSLVFAVFFVVVFLSYYCAGRNNRIQNCILLISSYFFYGCANWKLLPILIVSTTIFFFLGLRIKSSEEKAASRLKIAGVMIGIGLLVYFKYLNFFIFSFARLFESFGLHTNWHFFNIYIPLGISFYTFKLISYVIDVEHEEIEPTRDFIQFANYIAFFPCILSGPIDRPKQILPQLNKVRRFDYSSINEGVIQFVLGCFKKIVIADNCAEVVNSVWDTLGNQSGSTLLFAAIIFFFQIYADFSGYSDMAIGISRMLGIKVTRNFNHPIFSLSIADYWRRWHISLTQWLTDYVFMPLNFTLRRYGKVGMIIAITVNFLLVGLWHGPNWNYILFGLLQVVWFIPSIISNSFMRNEEIEVNHIGLPVAKHFCKMIVTFILVIINGILFRAESLAAFWFYCKVICSKSLLMLPSFQREVNTCALLSCIFILILIIMEWKSRNQDYFLENCKSLAVRCFMLSFYVLTIYFLGQDSNWFIYFQY